MAKHYIELEDVDKIILSTVRKLIGKSTQDELISLGLNEAEAETCQEFYSMFNEDGTFNPSYSEIKIN